MRVLLLASEHSLERHDVQNVIAELLPKSEIDVAVHVPAALDLVLIENRHPVLLVVVQNWPDEFTRANVAALYRAAPLARWICRYGPWCESDGRNRNLWPAGCRVSASGFRARLRREIEVLAGTRSPLPLTASRDEVFEFDSVRLSCPASRARRVDVASPDREYRRFLADLAASRGHHVTTVNADVALFDLDPLPPGGFVPVKTARRNIGLLGLPFDDDRDRAAAAGFSTVLSKLAPIEELLAAVES